ncbi:hypothetical protein [Cognataquiflexum nitidum]|uniref:hypothetical protein n=1 Tax=Cognataquiflexum nitidum TaxID=2922272 RepID=UPI001F134D6E|nr:hypothetical protein [Cognataquiflexum nitidum]
MSLPFFFVFLLVCHLGRRVEKALFDIFQGDSQIPVFGIILGSLKQKLLKRANYFEHCAIMVDP